MPAFNFSRGSNPRIPLGTTSRIVEMEDDLSDLEVPDSLPPSLPPSLQPSRNASMPFSFAPSHDKASSQKRKRQFDFDDSDEESAPQTLSGKENRNVPQQVSSQSGGFHQQQQQQQQQLQQLESSNLHRPAGQHLVDPADKLHLPKLPRHPQFGEMSLHEPEDFPSETLSDDEEWGRPPQTFSSQPSQSKQDSEGRQGLGSSHRAFPHPEEHSRAHSSELESRNSFDLGTHQNAGFAAERSQPFLRDEHLPSSQRSSIHSSNAGFAEERAQPFTGDEPLSSSHRSSIHSSQSASQSFHLPLGRNDLHQDINSSRRPSPHLPLGRSNLGSQSMRVDFDLHQSSSDRRPRHDSSSSQPERRNLLDLLSQRQELPAAPLPYDELEPPPPPRGRRSIPGPACDQHAEDGTSAITLAAAQAKPRSEEDLGPIPTLPLRKHRPIPERNDPDFHGAPWMKMLQDLDVVPVGAQGCTLDTLLASCYFRTPIAKVLKEAYLKKVPRLVVIIKSISFGDECADALIKDPTGEMRATVHGKVLEEEGDDLARGSGLVLRKVTVYNAYNGQSHLAIITPNNVVRCYPPASAAVL